LPQDRRHRLRVTFGGKFGLHRLANAPHRQRADLRLLTLIDAQAASSSGTSASPAFQGCAVFIAFSAREAHGDRAPLMDAGPLHPSRHRY
jgi:hypothetical protein